MPVTRTDATIPWLLRRRDSLLLLERIGSAVVISLTRQSGHHANAVLVDAERVGTVLALLDLGCP